MMRTMNPGLATPHWDKAKLQAGLRNGKLATFSNNSATPDVQLEVARVQHHIDVYRNHQAMLRRDGCSLFDYVETALRDSGSNMSEALASELKAMQAEFGDVLDPSNWLASGLTEA